MKAQARWSLDRIVLGMRETVGMTRAGKALESFAAIAVESDIAPQSRLDGLTQCASGITP